MKTTGTTALMLALHARVEELEKDRGNAKRLVSKIWNQHPEARDTIEKATGAWLVFGQDIETDGVSAQLVTQGKDHIAQPTQMATTTVVLPEPIGTVGAAPGTSGFTLTVFEAARVPVGTNIYTEQQVCELLATGSQPQADALDAQRWLDYLIRNQARVCNNLDEYEGDEDCADCGYWLEFTDINSQRWVQIGVFKTPCDAIDAAIAAEKEHK